MVYIWLKVSRGLFVENSANFSAGVINGILATVYIMLALAFISTVAYYLL